ncbi:MAG: Molybdenum cofactor biosynthesis protein MoaD [uncultured Sulfurovum sp.]|uniref:Molybdenum cofactor biosynthesis protein MoaD n=1 Tax=uncultured Sulfurovum sp. TaxID=269237 RepID=A0A6S6TRJ2_9BACT|nr:MAG: Molybdenum cofactor biosynthesis protein MoaD [uncultured Sulfurovum sp.]
MMIKVEFLGPMAQEVIELEAHTLADVATQLQNIESVAPWLEKCAVAVNDEMTANLGMQLNDGDKVSILPPVCGG